MWNAASKMVGAAPPLRGAENAGMEATKAGVQYEVGNLVRASRSPVATVSSGSDSAISTQTNSIRAPNILVRLERKLLNASRSAVTAVRSHRYGRKHRDRRAGALDLHGL